MKTEIYPIPLGMSNCYLVKEKGTILIDSGFPNQDATFLKATKQIGINPSDIHVIILTHGHCDHIGSIAALKRITGGKIAIHRNEKHYVEQALKPLPPGIGAWGKAWLAMMKVMVRGLKFPGTSVDIVIEDEDYSLEAFGINGRVIHTPGHSSGSSSVVLDSGEAFVGDLAMNGFPMRPGPGMPIFAEDIGMVRESWGKLLDNGIRTVYPGHGKPFNAEILREKMVKTAESSP